MAYLLICVKKENTILHHGIYSRDLAPVKFDNSSVGIALRHDPCFDWAQYFVMCYKIISVPNEHYRPKFWIGSIPSAAENNKEAYQCVCTAGYESSFVKCDYCTRQSRTIEVPTLSFISIDAQYVLNVDLPADIAYHSFQAFSSSYVFRKSFVNFIQQYYQRSWIDCRDCVCSCEEVRTTCELTLNIPHLIQVLVQPSEERLCHAWCKRLQCLGNKRLILEETMAWLSTLGGGFSALGDYFMSFSELAGRLSQTQLQIATEMGDPVLASKCRLFYALSLMQLGPLRQSKHIIRQEYILATQSKYRDQKLVDMCKGMWAKLQYFYSLRKTRAKLPSSCSHNGVSPTHRPLP
ncbi:uncharacterized protein F58A4.6-like isoform X2 [Mya arenaria]|nr:uncharacterized protein F58A4.6-like isoform X2 [Mya arenaria]XP_052800209.1 uncharacterized protein F58A4.6-like isoform X2 [Mya arenaria]